MYQAIPLLILLVLMLFVVKRSIKKYKENNEEVERKDIRTFSQFYHHKAKTFYNVLIFLIVVLVLRIIYIMLAE